MKECIAFDIAYISEIFPRVISIILYTRKFVGKFVILCITVSMIPRCSLISRQTLNIHKGRANWYLDGLVKIFTELFGDLGSPSKEYSRVWRYPNAFSFVPRRRSV